MVDGLCCSMLRKKYLGQKSIFQVKNKQGSQFWRSLLELRMWYQRGRVVEIKRGQQTRFWHDCWLGVCPLKIQYHRLFQITAKPDIEVAQAFVEGQWRFSLEGNSMGHSMNIGTNFRKCCWKLLFEKGLESSRKYSTSSLYKFMASGGVKDNQMMTIWKCNIPLEVKIFVWMAVHDRIQSRFS